MAKKRQPVPSARLMGSSRADRGAGTLLIPECQAGSAQSTGWLPVDDLAGEERQNWLRIVTLQKKAGGV